MPYSFEGITNSIDDKNHLAYDALKLRKNPPEDKQKKNTLKN